MVQSQFLKLMADKLSSGMTLIHLEPHSTRQKFQMHGLMHTFYPSINLGRQTKAIQKIIDQYHYYQCLILKLQEHIIHSNVFSV